MWNREARRACSILVVQVLMSFPAAVWAKVAEIPLKELVAQSDLIVLAKVSKVEDGPAEIKTEDDRSFPRVKVAAAEVIETWKGRSLREVRYVASPLWTCDISSAETGERVVLFLVSGKDSPIMMIAHSGRGRMPLRQVEGKSYATIWSEDVQLPRGTVTIPGPEPRYSFIRSIELSKLKELVRESSRGITWVLRRNLGRGWEIVFIAAALVYGIRIDRHLCGSGGILGGIVAGVLALMILMTFHYFHDADFEDEGLGLLGSLLIVACPIGWTFGAIAGTTAWLILDVIPGSTARGIPKFRSWHWRMRYPVSRGPRPSMRKG
jgi:hypothetical protein